MNETAETSPKPSPIVPFETRYDIVGVVCEKGGIGKTFLITRLIAVGLMSGASIRVVEVDKQHRLKLLYGDRVIRIDLPDTEAVAGNDYVDTIALAPLYSALTAPKEEGLVFFDIGANLDERVSTGLVQSGIQQAISESGRRVALLVCLDEADDTIAAAARTAELYSKALPFAEIMFAVTKDDLILDPKGMSVEARRGFESVIQPLLAKRQLVVMEKLKDGAFNAFASLKVDPLRFMSLPPEVVGRDALKGVRVSNETAYYWTGLKFQSDLKANIGELAMEAGRMLGFRSARAAGATEELEEQGN